MGTANIQGELWGARAKDWAELGEPLSQPAYNVAFARTGVRADTKMLDIGCGAGTALAMARGLGASVTGVDATKELVEIARLRLPGARIDRAEMEDLPFPNAAFEIVTGFNAFQYAAEPLQALREARRICRPRGKLVAQIWGRREHCESTSSTVAAVLALLPPPPANQPKPTAQLTEPGTLERVMESAGLELSDSGDVDIPFLFRDAATAYRCFASDSVVVEAIKRVGEEAVKKAIFRSFAPFTRTDGSIAQRNRFRWVIASPR